MMGRWPGNTAVTAVLREGRQVPMGSIAADAGVGIGTLYRRYPNREAPARH
jgi:AcrR family transcriptional regulator